MNVRYLLMVIKLLQRRKMCFGDIATIVELARDTVSLGREEMGRITFEDLLSISRNTIIYAEEKGLLDKKESQKAAAALLVLLLLEEYFGGEP